MCERHPDQIYEAFCNPCNIALCCFCKKDKNHQIEDLKEAYENKLEQYNEILMIIRSEHLYNVQALAAEIKTDFDNSKNAVNLCLSEMAEKSKVLKAIMDTLTKNILRIFERLLLYNLASKMKKMDKHIGKITCYERGNEQSANKPVQFLRLIKTIRFPVKRETPKLTQQIKLTLCPQINIPDMICFLSEIKITGSRKRKIRKERLLKLNRTPVLKNSIKVKNITHCYHITCVTPDQAWFSDYASNLTLTDTKTGETLHQVTNMGDRLRGCHSIDNESDLIYIDKYNNIKKLSIVTKTRSTLIKKVNLKGIPLCLHWSLSNGHLLVGIMLSDTKVGGQKGNVTRYSSTGELTYESTDHSLYCHPQYITENNNGDVVVSDDERHAVVVTSQSGKHRFSYQGHPSNAGLKPNGICTDALSHILVCDDKTYSVQLIDKNGQFLSKLLTNQSPGISRFNIGSNTDSDSPDFLNKLLADISEKNPSGIISLSYDFNSHLLWVASGWDNTASVYRYINRNRELIGKYL